MVVDWTKKAGAAVALAALAACGGGGGGSVEAEATVSSVSAPTILEGNAGTSELLFTVTLNKPAVNTVRVSYSTASTAKSGGGATGSATGGAACGAGVDYVAANGAELAIAKGNSSGVIRVPVCTDAAFEPLETLNLVWSQGGTGGTVLATVVNDDAGGLNGTGVATGFGRDSLALTNANADGRLGFSYALVAGAGGVQCIRDNVTGLLWEGKTVANELLTYNHADALAYAIAVNGGAGLCGFTDWRVPTPEELASIVDNSLAAPAVDVTWFARQQTGEYWAKTEYRNGAAPATDAWFVDFSAVGPGAINRKPVGQVKFVRLVSNGGSTAPAPLPAFCGDASRFVNHGDGTVTDNRTGLMWKQCAEGLSGAGCASGTTVNLDWNQAMALPATVNANPSGAGLGYSDWRLPNRAELSSIAEREQCYNPSITTSVFPGVTGVNSDFWSSTPYVLNGNFAFWVGFFDGEVSPAQKTGGAASAKRVRLVRAGQ